MPKSKKQQKAVSVATNANSMFNPSKTQIKEPHCVQNVNVEINIDQKDDCMAGCFKALGGIFKKG